VPKEHHVQGTPGTKRGLPSPAVALRRALELDENQGGPHALLGFFFGVADYDWRQSPTHFRRALELDPLLADIRMAYADWHLRPLGRLDEALAELDAIRHKDPLSVVAGTGPLAA
jgi:Tfp pilus assembly protein PilF